MRYGYLPFIIRVEQRLTYYDTLDIAHLFQNYESFIQLVAEEEHEGLSSLRRPLHSQFTFIHSTVAEV